MPPTMPGHDHDQGPPASRRRPEEELHALNDMGESGARSQDGLHSVISQPRRERHHIGHVTPCRRVHPNRRTDASPESSRRLPALVTRGQSQELMQQQHPARMFSLADAVSSGSVGVRKRSIQLPGRRTICITPTAPTLDTTASFQPLSCQATASARVAGTSLAAATAGGSRSHRPTGWEPGGPR